MRIPSSIFAVGLMAMGSAVSAQSPARPLSPTPAEVEAIGTALVDAVGTAKSRILLFGRFSPGFAGTTIRYVADGSPAVRPAFFKASNNPDLAGLWNKAYANWGDGLWVEMIFVVDHGRVNLTLHYPDQVDFNSSYSEAASKAERELLGRKRD